MPRLPSRFKEITTNSNTQVFCAVCAIMFPLVMFAGLWPAAGFFPPLDPSATAAEIADIYRRHTSGIRFGMILLLLSCGLYAAFVALVSAQMRRIETGNTPILTYLQLISGIAVLLFLVIPALIWSVAAFRPERSPDITQALNDIGWFFFVMPFSLPFAQNVAIGAAILSDKNPIAILPRWLGFFNLWVAVLLMPAALLTFFKTGPFAWNGILSFWIPAAVFGIWIFVMAAALIKAARRTHG